MRLSGAWNDASYTTHDATTGGGLDDAFFARVRAVPLQDTNSPTTLQGVLAEAKASGAPFTSVVGIRPTGWAHTNIRKGGERGGNRGVQPSLSETEPAGAEDETQGFGFRDRFHNDVGKVGEVESVRGKDENDEAAAWGATRDGGEAEERGAVDAERETPPPASLQAGGAWNGKKPWVEGNARVYSLPYSEHSSYTQLKDFVRSVRPK